MAYARKGPDSDIYLYRSGSSDLWECHCASIHYLPTILSVAEHILWHINEQRDKVPTSCINRILHELDEPEYEDEPLVRCDVCDVAAEPGAPFRLRYCVDCGNCTDHCECSIPDYDTMAKDDLIDFTDDTSGRYA